MGTVYDILLPTTKMSLKTIKILLDSEIKKYRLPKDHGGLATHDLEVKNTAILGKWLFKLLTKDGV